MSWQNSYDNFCFGNCPQTSITTTKIDHIIGSSNYDKPNCDNVDCYCSTCCNQKQQVSQCVSNNNNNNNMCAQNNCNLTIGCQQPHCQQPQQSHCQQPQQSHCQQPQLQCIFPPKCQPQCDISSALVTSINTPQQIQDQQNPLLYTRVINWNLIADIRIGNITYNAVNGEFSVPKSGFYALSAFITWDTNGFGSREISFYKVSGLSTASILAADTRLANTALPTSTTLSTEVWLTACDRIFLSVWQNSESILPISSLGSGNKISIIQLN